MKYLKYLFILLLLIPITAGAAVINSSSSINLTKGLVGYWTMDGKDTNWNTNTTNDMSGNGNTGTMTSMSTSSAPVAGKIGQTLKFDGVDDYINCGTNFGLSGDFSGTITAWIKRAGGTDFQTVMIAGSAVALQSFSLGVNINGEGSFSTEFNGGKGRSTASGLIPLNTWSFLTVVKTPGAIESTVKLYLNGAEVAQAAGQTGTPNFVADKCYIGAWTNLDYKFNGSLDDVRIYNRALSAQEVKTLYQTGAATIAHSNTGISSGLVGYWTMDGKDTVWTSATAGTTKDLSGNNNTGTLTSMSQSASPVSGKIGQAFKFDGSTNYVSVPDSVLYNFGTGDFATSYWQKFNNVSSPNYQVPLDGGYGGSAGVLIETSDNEKLIRVYLSATLAGTWSWNFIVDTWYNVVVTRTGNQLSVFVNGSQLGSPSTNSTSVAHGGYLIGKYSGGEWVNGLIDDVRIYNRALSATEITTLYNTGKATIAHSNTGISNGLVGYWTFDGNKTSWSSATAGTTNDSSGQNNTGTMTNMSQSASPVAGKIGQALKFDGVNGYVAISYMSALNVGSAYTVSVWINISGTQQNRPIIEWGAYNTNGFLLRTDEGCSGCFAIYTGNAGAITWTYGFTPGTWYHIVISQSATNARTAYVNGVSQGLNNTVSNSVSSSGTFNIGQITSGGVSGGPWSGSIDDVRIYNRALSAQEVKTLYQTGK